MAKKKYNLIQIFGLKEGIFWKRTWTMHTKFNWIGKLSMFPIALLLISLAHYAFALMHFLFESFLFMVHKGQFQINLNKMRTQLS